MCQIAISPLCDHTMVINFNNSNKFVRFMHYWMWHVRKIKIFFCALYNLTILIFIVRKKCKTDVFNRRDCTLRETISRKDLKFIIIWRMMMMMTAIRVWRLFPFFCMERSKNAFKIAFFALLLMHYYYSFPMCSLILMTRQWKHLKHNDIMSCSVCLFNQQLKMYYSIK